MQIQYSSNNVIVKIPVSIADKNLYAKTILASSLTDIEKQRLLVEAGIFDAIKGLVSSAPIPEQDFKTLWSNQSPGGAFTPQMVAWKKAADSGQWNAQKVSTLLQTMSSFSPAAQAFYAKNKALLDALLRGTKSPAIEKGWADLMNALTPSLALIQKTKPAYYTGSTSIDKQVSPLSTR